MPPTPPAPQSRQLQPERMDDPALDPAPHRRALRGLARINAVSLADRPFRRPLESLARRTAAPLTVLDVACGSGDVLDRLARRGARLGLSYRFTACDISAVALEEARRRSPDIETVRRDVIAEGLPGEYDVVMCSLFLHHLTDDRIVTLLRSMRRSARRAVLISDLNRTRAGLLLARLAPRLLTRSAVVHTDAILSARAALTTGEITDLAEEAGLEGATVTRDVPSRWLVDWRSATIAQSDRPRVQRRELSLPPLQGGRA